MATTEQETTGFGTWDVSEERDLGVRQLVGALPVVVAEGELHRLDPPPYRSRIAAERKFARHAACGGLFCH